MSKPLGIGSTIWKFDSNYRVYKSNASISSSASYREQWRPVVITGETSRSWIIGGRNNAKCPKKGGYGWALSEKEVYDDVWLKENRYKIMQRLNFGSNQSVEVFRKIAELIGYEESPVEAPSKPE